VFLHSAGLHTLCYDRFLSSLDAEDLPSFVYLLLLLASKGERTRILSAVIQCFNNLDMNADHRNAAKVFDASEADDYSHIITPFFTFFTGAN
jgi:hypothetical protein